MHTSDTPAGTLLLPIFGLATIIGIVAIGLLIAYPSTVTAIVALATVIGFAAGLVALLAHLIGPEGNRPRPTRCAQVS